MVAAAKLSPNAPATRSRSIDAAPATPPEAPAGEAPATPGDTFARTRGSAAPSRPGETPTPAPANADPELARQARSGLIQANFAARPGSSRPDRGETPNRPDGANRPGTARGVTVTHSDAGDLSATNVGPAQDAFRGEMRTALGRTVANPPSEADLRAYFRTLRGRPDDAIRAYERYSDAYARHDGEHDYRSRDRQYVLDDGRVLSGEREAERLRRQGHNYNFYENNAPNNFREATRDRERDHRSAMDCEGFAVSADTLLGEAGFDMRHVVGNVSRDDGHAVAVARDPASGNQWVLSNGDAYRVNGSLRSTLDSAYGDTTISSLPSTYYEGRSQDEAAFRQMRGVSDGRIP